MNPIYFVDFKESVKKNEKKRISIKDKMNLLAILETLKIKMADNVSCNVKGTIEKVNITEYRKKQASFYH